MLSTRLKLYIYIYIYIYKYKRVTLNVKLKPPVGVSKSLISESLRLNRII